MKRVLEEHFRYLSDDVRTAAYREAFARIIRPSDVVLDIGCGTGILGLLACEAGAASVIAIDEGGILDVARQMAHHAGFADRISHLRAHSTTATLDRHASVLVCDQIGPLGFDAGILKACADARARLLAPDARVVPSEFSTWFAPVEAPRTFHHIEKWAAPLAGFTFEPMRQVSVNTVHAIVDTHTIALAEPEMAWHFELGGGADIRYPLRRSLRWDIERAGVCHGLEGSFLACLAPGIEITNRPGAGNQIARATVLLGLPQAVPVTKGDGIVADLLADPDRVLAWTITFERSGERLTLGPFSTLQGRLWSAEDLQAAATRPRPPRR